MRKNRVALALAKAFPFAFPLNFHPTGFFVPAPAFPIVLATAFALPVAAQNLTDGPVKTLGVVTVTSGQPTSLPTQIPTTIEGITKTQIEQTINATDSEDALRYFPSLLVRKRYIGDYNHAVLSSRASGTGNSARSAVYADGVLLSNYLGNGATFTPRWAMVTPEEIERVDVMYGPFSAAYPGNSVGAVVDYVTRMPTQFEGHAKLGMFTQNFSLYNSNSTFSGNQASASLGNKAGDWSWFVNLNHTDSTGQPLVFATRTASATVAGVGQAVTGAVAGLDRTNTPWYLLGSTTSYHTVQDHAKLKLAYDFSPTLKASYTLGLWNNTSEGRPETYLRNAAGQPVYSGLVNINGSTYSLAGATPLFNATNESISHVMHGLSVKSNTRGVWDWEVAASLYDYAKDQNRAATTVLPGALTGGAGNITDMAGTGWNTLAAKGIWRPGGSQGEHVVDFGLQQERYALRILRNDITTNWLTAAPGALNSDVGGYSQLQSVYAQDTWSFAQKWKAVLGARVENWSTWGGFTKTAASSLTYASREETSVSPKAALAYQWSGDTVLKASMGKAVRNPTVQEMYGATTGGALTVINDPNLRPEKSVTTELSYEKDLGNGLLRVTLFNENVNDSLYSQLIPGSTTVSRVQNVDAISTNGLELAFQGENVGVKGLDLSGSITYADSRITANSGFAASVGKYQPRVPVWRATALANYRFNDNTSTSLGVRYSGDQFTTLDNSDINGFAYTASSRYLIWDVRARHRISKTLVASFGIDNLTDQEYWNFHPYPKRTWVAEIKADF